MIFVSRYGNPSYGVRDEISEQYSTGKRIIQRGLEAQFTRHAIPDYVKEIGVKQLHHHGQLEDRIDGGKMSPESRISWFDSVATQKHLRWTDEEREEVEQSLLQSDRYGLDYIKVDEPKRPAPWAGYDRLDSAEKIAELTLATGSAVADVIAYERENENREEVLAALEDLSGEAGQEKEVVLDAS